MCGIVGALTPNKIRSDYQKRAALSLLAHRGPDAQGEFKDIATGIWMGHTRLSILDLSAAGAQPMRLEEESLVLSFNGEIYNHQQLRRELEGLGRKFNSTSDTEVVLQAWSEWGTNCLQRFIGMFAFALWDERKELLFVGRDRAGEKPLFYLQQGKSFFFASELNALKALLGTSPTLNNPGLCEYLMQGYVSGTSTLWEGIAQVAPGQVLTFSSKTQSLTKQWYWKNEVADSGDLMEDPVQELELLLGKVIQEQLIADVPISLMLSGGLDSSLLASYVAEFNPTIQAFTVVFPGYEQLNEGAFAKKIATHFNLQHEEISCDQIQFSDWFSLMQQVDIPISDPAFYPTYLMSKAMSRQGKVALGGDGADEVFGGYQRYTDLLELKRKAALFPLFARKFISKTAFKMLPIGAKGRHSLMEFGTDFKNNVPNVPAMFLPEELQQLLKPAFSEFIHGTEPSFQGTTVGTGDWLEAVLAQDFKSYLPDNILTKVDRASMLASLEVRAPYLDKRVLDFSAKLPVHWKVHGKERKVLLRKLAAKRLPTNWNIGRKQGFVPPLSDWLKEKEWKGVIEEYLLGKDSIFQADFIHGLLKGQAKGRFNKRRIYALLVLAIHLKQAQH